MWEAWEALADGGCRTRVPYDQYSPIFKSAALDEVSTCRSVYCRNHQRSSSMVDTCSQQTLLLDARNCHIPCPIARGNTPSLSDYSLSPRGPSSDGGNDNCSAVGDQCCTSPCRRMEDYRSHVPSRRGVPESSDQASQTRTKGQQLQRTYLHMRCPAAYTMPPFDQPRCVPDATRTRANSTQDWPRIAYMWSGGERCDNSTAFVGTAPIYLV